MNKKKAPDWIDGDEAREWLRGVDDGPKVRALVAWAETGLKVRAAEAAKRSRVTLHRWLTTDETFRRAWDEAAVGALYSLEDELHRRAQAGSDDKGSAVLLMFALKAMDRDRYEGSKDKGEGHQPPAMHIHVNTPREGE